MNDNGLIVICVRYVSVQLKYSILFCGHSLPRLAAPLTAAAAVAPQPFLPAQSHLTVFSLVQCCEGDPPLRVIETEDQLNEGFAKAIRMVKVDNENKKVSVIEGLSTNVGTMFLVAHVFKFSLITNRQKYGRYRRNFVLLVTKHLNQLKQRKIPFCGSFVI